MAHNNHGERIETEDLQDWLDNYAFGKLIVVYTDGRAALVRFDDETGTYGQVALNVPVFKMRSGWFGSSEAPAEIMGETRED